MEVRPGTKLEKNRNHQILAMPIPGRTSNTLLKGKRAGMVIVEDGRLLSQVPRMSRRLVESTHPVERVSKFSGITSSKAGINVHACGNSDVNSAQFTGFWSSAGGP